MDNSIQKNGLYQKRNQWLIWTVAVLLTATLGGSGIFSNPVQGAVFQGESYKIWPDKAPGETVCEPNVEKTPGSAQKVTDPRLYVFRAKEQKSDACIILFPGGGYSTCFYQGEGSPNVTYWNSKGITVFVLVYRVPRPVGEPIYQRAWQDAQRTVRFVRKNAERFNINPEKIGVEGYSAGGHLALMAATQSQTRSYKPIDELDQISCHVNFALPVYVPYVLEDGSIGPNAKKGNSVPLLPELKFDEKTPPMILIHGDNDIYSPMGSVQVYRQLRKMNVPCELHIFSKAPHGFMFWNNLENAKTWKDRSYEWMKTMKLL